MAWTYSITTLTGQHEFVRGDGRVLTCFGLDVLSDATSSGDITLSTELVTTYGAGKAEQLMQKIRGASLHWVNFIAGAATPTTQTTITVDDQNGLLLFSEQVAVAGTSEGFNGAVDTTNAPIIDAIIAMTTLANTKTATVYFWFIK